MEHFPQAAVFGDRQFQGRCLKLLYTSDPAPQFLVLGITYIVVDGIFLSFYGLSAGCLAGKLTRGLRARTGLFSGGMIIVAAAPLALKGG